MEESGQNRGDWKKLVEDEAKLRGYSNKTINSYLFHIEKFIQSNKSPKEFLLELINNQKGR